MSRVKKLVCGWFRSVQNPNACIPHTTQGDNKDATLLQPQDRVAAVRPLWETLTQEQRVELLTVDLPTLREKAKLVLEQARQQAGEAGMTKLEQAVTDLPALYKTATGWDHIHTDIAMQTHSSFPTVTG